MIGPIQSPLTESPRDAPELAVSSKLGAAEPVQIRYSIEGLGGPVELAIYDGLGRKIFAWGVRHQERGTYLVTWDAGDRSGRNVSSGVYMARLLVGKTSITKKFVLMR